MNSVQRWLLSVLCGAGLISHTALSVADDRGYADAEFSVSSDPARVVLFVQGYSVSADVADSMRLFGDGRLEIAVAGRGRREIQLSESAMHELIATAVRHGLAEWDTPRIESEMAMARNGRETATMDGYVVSVTLALESYRRGQQERAQVLKKMSVASPDISMRYFPEIDEFHGLFELQRYLQRAVADQGLHQ